MVSAAKYIVSSVVIYACEARVTEVFGRDRIICRENSSLSPSNFSVLTRKHREVGAVSCGQIWHDNNRTLGMYKEHSRLINCLRVSSVNIHDLNLNVNKSL